MPAIRTNSSSSTSSSSNSNSITSTPTKGWTRDQKAQLFYHVVKHGEREWRTAVDGKTGHQAQEQWKSPHAYVMTWSIIRAGMTDNADESNDRKTLLPQIQRACGF